jgi:hypothetical protein
MALPIREINTDHHGNELPADICACARKDNSVIVSFKVRWREEDEDGILRQRSKSFSGRKHKSLDRALEAAVAFLAGAQEAVRVDGSVARPDTSAAMTVEEVFREWLVIHGPEVSQGYAEKAVRLWDKEIATRPISRTRLDRISDDQATLTRFQDSLVKDEMKATKRREVLKLFRAVLRWGRRRHPNALRVELSGLIQLPEIKRSRLAYAADAIGVERIIEAVSNRPVRDDLTRLRDVALVAAQGYTLASRPSEWLQSATRGDLYPESVELQRAASRDASEDAPGLKTGAHVALVFANARDRIDAYLRAIDDRYGPQPGQSLIFQVIDEGGPVWWDDGGDELVPLAWDINDYNRWTARVWRPARKEAALAPDTPSGLASMTFYDLRHTIISMALHSTLAMGPSGMNLHPIAAWAGHDIATLERYYRHFIARYAGQPPIDLDVECKSARTAVEAEPFRPNKREGPQRKQQRQRRARASTSERRKRSEALSDRFGPQSVHRRSERNGKSVRVPT